MGGVGTPRGKAAPLPSQTPAGFTILKVCGVSHSSTSWLPGLHERVRGGHLVATTAKESSALPEDA